MQVTELNQEPAAFQNVIKSNTEKAREGIQKNKPEMLVKMRLLKTLVTPGWWWHMP